MKPKSISTEGAVIVGSGDLLGHICNPNNVFKCKIYLVAAFLCSQSINLKAFDGINQSIKPLPSASLQIALDVSRLAYKFRAMISEGALFANFLHTDQMQSKNLHLPSASESYEVTPPLGRLNANTQPMPQYQTEEKSQEAKDIRSIHWQLVGLYGLLGLIIGWLMWPNVES